MPVTYCTAGLAMIIVILDLFRHFNRILNARPPLPVLLAYLGGHLSAYLQWFLPAALLLGGLYAMWQLARHNEITAMRAGGIPFSTITAPMLAAAAALAALSALNSEFYMPRASRERNAIVENQFQPPADKVLEDVPYHNFAERRIWRIGRWDPAAPGRLHDVRVTRTGPDGLPEIVLTAPLAEHLDGVWWFHEPAIVFYDQAGRPRKPPEGFAGRTLLWLPHFNEIPRDFLMETVTQGEIEQQNLSLRDMIRYVKTRPRLPHDVKVAWRYDIHCRLAAPWSCVVITLFAIPAGVATGRQSVFSGVLMALGLFFLFFAATMLCMVAVRNGFISAPAGAWLPNILFLCAGAALFHRQR